MSTPMTTQTATASTHRALGTKQRVGLVLAIIYSLGNIPSVFFQTDSGQTGPPLGILVIGTVLGVIGLVASVLAWRGNRAMLRLAAACIIVETLTALPAFFVDVPMGVKMLVSFCVVITVAALVLMFSEPSRATTVTD